MNKEILGQIATNDQGHHETEITTNTAEADTVLETNTIFYHPKQETTALIRISEILVTLKQTNQCSDGEIV